MVGFATRVLLAVHLCTSTWYVPGSLLCSYFVPLLYNKLLVSFQFHAYHIIKIRSAFWLDMPACSSRIYSSFYEYLVNCKNTQIHSLFLQTRPWPLNLKHYSVFSIDHFESISFNPDKYKSENKPRKHINNRKSENQTLSERKITSNSLLSPQWTSNSLR